MINKMEHYMIKAAIRHFQLRWLHFTAFMVILILMGATTNTHARTIHRNVREAPAEEGGNPNNVTTRLHLTAIESVPLSSSSSSTSAPTQLVLRTSTLAPPAVVNKSIEDIFNGNPMKETTSTTTTTTTTSTTEAPTKTTMNNNNDPQNSDKNENDTETIAISTTETILEAIERLSAVRTHTTDMAPSLIVREGDGIASNEKRAKFINGNATNAQQLQWGEASAAWSLAAGINMEPTATPTPTSTQQPQPTTYRPSKRVSIKLDLNDESGGGGDSDLSDGNDETQRLVALNGSEKNLLDWQHIVLQSTDITETESESVEKDDGKLDGDRQTEAHLRTTLEATTNEVVERGTSGTTTTAAPSFLSSNHTDNVTLAVSDKTVNGSSNEQNEHEQNEHEQNEREQNEHEHLTVTVSVGKNESEKVTTTALPTNNEDRVEKVTTVATTAVRVESANITESPNNTERDENPLQAMSKERPLSENNDKITALAKEEEQAVTMISILNVGEPAATAHPTEILTNHSTATITDTPIPMPIISSTPTPPLMMTKPPLSHSNTGESDDDDEHESTIPIPTKSTPSSELPETTTTVRAKAPAIPLDSVLAAGNRTSTATLGGEQENDNDKVLLTAIERHLITTIRTNNETTVKTTSTVSPSQTNEIEEEEIIVAEKEKKNEFAVDGGGVPLDNNHTIYSNKTTGTEITGQIEKQIEKQISATTIKTHLDNVDNNSNNENNNNNSNERENVRDALAKHSSNPTETETITTTTVTPTLITASGGDSAETSAEASTQAPVLGTESAPATTTTTTTTTASITSTTLSSSSSSFEIENVTPVANSSLSESLNSDADVAAAATSAPLPTKAASESTIASEWTTTTAASVWPAVRVSELDRNNQEEEQYQSRATTTTTTTAIPITTKHETAQSIETNDIDVSRQQQQQLTEKLREAEGTTVIPTVTAEIPTTTTIPFGKIGPESEIESAENSNNNNNNIDIIVSQTDKKKQEEAEEEEAELTARTTTLEPMASETTTTKTTTPTTRSSFIATTEMANNVLNDTTTAATTEKIKFIATTTTEPPLISLLDDSSTTTTTTTPPPSSIATKIEEIYSVFSSTTSPSPPTSTMKATAFSTTTEIMPSSEETEDLAITTTTSNATSTPTATPTTTPAPTTTLTPEEYPIIVPVSTTITPTTTTTTTTAIIRTIEKDQNTSPPPHIIQAGFDDLNANTENGNTGSSPRDVNVSIAITVSVIGVAALLLLIAFLYVMRKRQKQTSYGQRCRPVSLDAYSLDNVSVVGGTNGGVGGSSIRRKGNILGGGGRGSSAGSIFARNSKRSYGNVAFDDPALRHNHLTASELIRFAERRTAIFEEFREVPQIIARADEVPAGCEDKNRYANVIPLPETRVMLQPLAGTDAEEAQYDERNEYINANYVRGPKDPSHYYIACQAPLESTVIDFWRMIWEQESRVIIQATDLTENGIEKCAEYLPPSATLDNHTTYGEFQVTLKHREVKDCYAISTILLDRRNIESNNGDVGDGSRELTHYWYQWPETGVPSEEAPIIAMLLEARSSLKSYALEDREKCATLKMNDTNTEKEVGEINGNNMPMEKFKAAQPNGNNISPRSQSLLTVHCSPGTGRTGTILACDIAIRCLEQPKRSVDIPQIVYYVRRGRASAVQTKDQYEFIYKVAGMYATKIISPANEN